MKEEQFRQAVSRTRALLQDLKAAGVTDLPQGPTPNNAGAQSRASKEEVLAPIRRAALQCVKCRLCKERKSVVFGEGSLEARVVFVGEGPGKEEDLQGRPFVGAAGRLLTQLLKEAGLKREEVYIANVVKCRPPGNRPPEPDEVAACFPYLEAQLTTIKPKVICALGRTAANTLLGTLAPMGSLRGQIFSWKEIPLVITFHPAYLLRNPAGKPLVEEDLKGLLRF